MKVDQHPNADSLYVEEIDVGEEKPRQVGVPRQLPSCIAVSMFHCHTGMLSMTLLASAPLCLHRGTLVALMWIYHGMG